LAQYALLNAKTGRFDLEKVKMDSEVSTRRRKHTKNYKNYEEKEILHKLSDTIEKVHY